jgi:predicted transcriptional regulator
LKTDKTKLQARDKLAGAIDRDRTYVLWRIAYIEEALREAQAGRFASAADVDRVFLCLRGRPRKGNAG